VRLGCRLHARLNNGEGRPPDPRLMTCPPKMTACELMPSFSQVLAPGVAPPFLVAVRLRTFRRANEARDAGTWRACWRPSTGPRRTLANLFCGSSDDTG